MAGESEWGGEGGKVGGLAGVGAWGRRKVGGRGGRMGGRGGMVGVTAGRVARLLEFEGCMGIQCDTEWTWIIVVFQLVVSRKSKSSCCLVCEACKIPVRGINSCRYEVGIH
jgi:hypothetical protein